LAAPKAGAHRVIKANGIVSFGTSQASIKFQFARPSSVLTSLLLSLFDRNSLILLTLAFWHGFCPAWGFVTVLARLT
jgi:hypothetical protein